jgi:2-oxoglutarate dehydrogenase E2 component (dihydrolipoamide succinyltransferase)
MPSTVTMPALGADVTEATVTRWLKHPGDPVEAGEPLLEVSTDKVDTEIPSPAAGTVLKLLAAEDETVPAGGELAVIEQAADTPAPAPPAAPGQPASGQPQAEPGMPAPVAPASVAPTPVDPGPAPRAPTPRTPTPRTPAAPVSAAPAPTAPAPPGAVSRAAARAPLPGTVAPLSRLRKTIARRMVESLATSAQLTTVQEVDLSRVSALRARAKDEFRQRHGVGLSYLPFFARAAIETLRAFPAFNATLTPDDQVIYHRDVHLSVAVDTPRGLLAPVIRNADQLGISGLARAIADVAARTRNNAIGADELTGGTFTITNIGSVETLFDTPIINQPQVAILATGAVVRRPAVVPGPDGGEAIAIRPMCFLPLTYDHRLIDGADAGRFVAAMRKRLEEGAFEADLGL